ncbi:hypothetical protein JKF63_04237 [Porcisia hertigi]|uniref:Uncharacterized protein n=1 Tax=Porcisia hertigi TaxID=2761500 RepID=A0A836L9Q5_9TRYP|nr:hypothetical protein JKF63_04237 [Porcisia hertigi]
MEAWFGYVISMSEIIYSMKLREYEGACVSLVQASTEVAASALAAADHPARPAKRWDDKSQCHCSTETSSVPRTAAAAAQVTDAQLPVSGGASDRNVPSSLDGAIRCASASVSAAALPPPPLRPSAALGTSGVVDVSPVSHRNKTSLTAASLNQKCSMTQSGTPSSVSVSLADMSASLRDGHASTSAGSAALSHAETFGAFLDALQLRRPMCTMSSRRRQIDNIQAEADCVFQELDDAFILQEGDAAAVVEACADIDLEPALSGALLGSRASRFQGAGNEVELGTASTHSRPLPLPLSPAVNNAGERHLLYGELTSVGIRQLQAVCMASSCVMREENRCSRSRDRGDGEDSFSAHPSTSVTETLGCTTAPASCSTVRAPSNVGLRSLHPCDSGGHCRNQVSQGAVIVAVDVGSGSGRLLFEWSRLAAAACRREHDSSCLRATDGGATSADATPPYLTSSVAVHSTPHASRSTSTASTSTKAKPHGNLLEAAYAPLGIMCPATVWRGWLGVGIEVVPSRMRIARKALAPHYLDLRQILRAPPTREGVCGPVAQLDSRLSEAVAFTPVCASYIASASPQLSSASHHVGATSTIGSPTLTGVSTAAASRLRVPQPSARVLLYEGDALAPGVLSNATLCRFPNIGHHDKPLLLRGSFTAHSAGTDARGRRGARAAASMSLASRSSNVSSGCNAHHRPAVRPNHYHLCRIEGAPPLTEREDPHLVVFCCGLGFDETQVRRLCQRLEDMLLCRSPHTRVTASSSVGDDPVVSQQLSEEESNHLVHHPRLPHPFIDQCEGAEAAVSMVNCALLPPPLTKDNGDAAIDTRFEVRPCMPPAADPAVDVETGAGVGSYRHWRSVTCVLLLRPMDVLQPTFPLFRYACRVYDTQHKPVSAEDTTSLLSTGCRADGSPVPFRTRTTPASESTPGSCRSHDILEGDVWTTVLETTWMNAAPAWVVRFHF